jgi:hypothetical protein
VSDDEILQPAAQEAVDAAIREAGTGDNYQVRVRCTNCGWGGAGAPKAIPRGTPVSAQSCPDCANSTLQLA